MPKIKNKANNAVLKPKNGVITAKITDTHKLAGQINTPLRDDE